ncbi:hypothetical protein GCM10010388_45880 [Streptomyces mauvecolor]
MAAATTDGRKQAQGGVDALQGRTVVADHVLSGGETEMEDVVERVVPYSLGGRITQQLTMAVKGRGGLDTVEADVDDVAGALGGVPRLVQQADRVLRGDGPAAERREGAQGREEGCLPVSAGGGG